MWLFVLICAAPGHLLTLTCCMYTSRVLHQSCFIRSWLSSSLILDLIAVLGPNPSELKLCQEQDRFAHLEKLKVPSKTIAKNQKAHRRENQQIHFLHTSTTLPQQIRFLTSNQPSTKKMQPWDFQVDTLFLKTIQNGAFWFQLFPRNLFA